MRADSTEITPSPRRLGRHLNLSFGISPKLALQLMLLENERTVVTLAHSQSCQFYRRALMEAEDWERDSPKSTCTQGAGSFQEHVPTLGHHGVDMYFRCYTVSEWGGERRNRSCHRKM